MAKKTPVKPQAKKSTAIETKTWREVIHTIDVFIRDIIHDRHSVSLSKTSQRRVVAYGPWLAVAFWLIAIPQLLALTNTGGFLSLDTLLETMVFSRESWTILLLFFVTSVGVASAITDLSMQKLRGWNHIYAVTLLNASYVLYQLLFNTHQAAGSLLGLAALGAALFVILDVRKYYKAR